MKHFAIATIILAGFTALADPPEPIHRDESPQPTIEPMSHFPNWNQHPYIMGHIEKRHVEPRNVEICYQLTGHVVNDDFMKCRQGYDYNAWVAGHFTN